MALTIKIEHEVSDEHLHHLFSTAMEGGVQYWARVLSYRWSTGEGNGCAADLVGFRATIEDCEDKPEAPEGERIEFGVTRRTIEDGVRRIAAGSFKIGGRMPLPQEVRYWTTQMLADDADAGVADVVVQVGLFEEIRYA